MHLYLQYTEVDLRVKNQIQPLVNIRYQWNQTENTSLLFHYTHTKKNISCNIKRAQKANNKKVRAFERAVKRLGVFLYCFNNLMYRMCHEWIAGCLVFSSLVLRSVCDWTVTPIPQMLWYFVVLTHKWAWIRTKRKLILL